MLTIHANGIWKKTAEILNKNLLATHESPTDWGKVKADLQGLSELQLDLVLRLIEQMERVNKADRKEAKPSRN